MLSTITESFFGSVALVRHPEEDEKRWLTLWNERRGQHEMIAANRLEQESFRECLDREIAWQLDLRRGKDYIISSMARLHIEQELELPGDSVAQPYIIEFFVTDPYGKTANAALEEQSNTRWLKATEILDGKTETGEPVDPRLVYLLDRFELISRHA
ncbi:hypothetical protein [Rubinisphaera margarita]|uniref:hypothetical protein n=1 Tax=Rubinisphaera margarita TaxID=2909586 RepID=UPI001EE9487B|nr:hypothetical protein [Rubinisphaera margarita]MCG6154858.1 hypothetical protein [Rubinisphaera margarita]